MPRCIYCDGLGVVERCAGGRAVVATEPGRPVARDCSDEAGGMVNFADAIVAAVGDEDVTCSIHGDSIGIIERRCGRGAIVTCKALSPIASDVADHACGNVYFADMIILKVRDKHIPAAIRGNADREVERGREWQSRHRRGRQRW